jgi:hypothetical protein
MKREENRYGIEIKNCRCVKFQTFIQNAYIQIFLLIEKSIKALYHLLEIVLLRSSYRL